MTTLSQTNARPAYDLEPYKLLSNEELTERIQKVRREMGRRLLILGHHYQQDEVIALSDLRQLAAADEHCRAIAFCGVHFMAETADILANRPEQLDRRRGERVTVVLPDMAAGCSLADMAEIDQVEDCWEQLGELIDLDDLMPITYVNSAAALKAFCGRHGGIVCTSANARAAPLGGNRPEAIRHSRVILWRGHCSVHQMFQPQHVERFRRQYPDIKIIVHPECDMSVVDQADVVGSTGQIIRAVEEAPPGTRWAIGTELHLVNRLKHEHPGQEIQTMYRIDLPHLCWSLENLAAGTPVNVIRVDDQTARWALVALERMLEVK